MHTFCTDSKGDIYSVIDKKWHTVLFGDLMEFAGCGDEITSIAGLVPVLDNGDTWWRELVWPDSSRTVNQVLLPYLL